MVEWADRCHLEIDGQEDGLIDAIWVSIAQEFPQRELAYLRKKMITWPVTGVGLQTLCVDAFWLDAGIESLNSSDMPWRDTGIDFGASKGDK